MIGRNATSEELMKLERYDIEKHHKDMADFQLSDTTYTDTPENVAQSAKADPNRHAIAILNDEDKLVGFFCLHLAEGPETYGFKGEHYALIRGLSIDDRYRRKGYASKVFSDPFLFIQSQIDGRITHLILAVNEKNIPAQKTYIKAGFDVLKRGVSESRGTLLVMGKRCLN
ncbi:GNAT family N-acetyltransferase [Streptococcus merionis]|nr:GNAT family N-acetyltransferase [Streptococcus merionis]